MEAKIYNQEGKEAGSFTLPENIFGLPWNADLVHQVAVSMAGNARNPIAHAKTRAEVRGGGKKPWKQKGTGRARHGSTRSPIWVGGGVAHGPRNDRDFSRKINKKMKAKALFTVLSQKFRDNEIFFIDSVNLKDGKTKEAVLVLKNLAKVSGFPSIEKKKKNALYLALPTHDKSVIRGMSNIGNVSAQEARNINPLVLLQYKTVAFVNPEESLKIFGLKEKNVPAENKTVSKEKVSKKVSKVTKKASPKKAKATSK